jgi:hypothetical protein
MNQFRVIVAGSRTFKNYTAVRDSLDKILSKRIGVEEIIIISGHAKGPDQLGERYAEERGFKCETYEADWTKYGNAAGYQRNLQMSKVADGLVAFWDGQSKGTQNMINIMYKTGKPVRIVRIR